MAWSDPIVPKIEPPENLKKQWFQLGSAKFQLLPKQYIFLAAQEEFLGYISGVGGGKTRIGAIKSAYLSMHPKNRGLVGREALPDLDDTAQRDLLDFLREAELLKEAPNQKTKRAIVHCIDPITQENLGYTSEIAFQHLDDPDHLRGRHLGWFWIDEGSELRSTKAWSTLVGRLRLPTFRGRYKGIVTGNPRGRNWIYDFFFNPEKLETMICGKPGCPLSDKECNKRLRLKRRSLHCTSYENYFLSPDYIDNMIASYTEEERRREVEAEFDVFEGQVFKEFREDLHVITAPASWVDGRPPKEWRRLLAVDVGGSSPWVFLWCAVDPHGNLVFYDEIHKVTSNVDELADLARPKMRAEDGEPYSFQAKVIDYENKIAAMDLQKRGIAMTNARKMNKSGQGGSTSMLSSYLHPNVNHHFPDYHQYAGKSHAPRCYITTKCVNLRRELPQQAWDRDGSTDALKDVMDRRIPHDTVDTMLYTVREMPHPATIAPMKYAVKGTNRTKMSELYWADLEREKEKQVDQESRRPYQQRIRLDIL